MNRELGIMNRFVCLLLSLLICLLCDCFTVLSAVIKCCAIFLLQPYLHSSVGTVGGAKELVARLQS